MGGGYFAEIAQNPDCFGSSETSAQKGQTERKVIFNQNITFFLFLITYLCNFRIFILIFWKFDPSEFAVLNITGSSLLFLTIYVFLLKYRY